MMKDLLIFLAQDPKSSASSVEGILKQFEWTQLLCFEDVETMLQELTRNPHLVFFGVDFLDQSGTAILKRIKRYDPEITMVCITSSKRVDQVPELLNLGAYSYITHDTDTEERIRGVVQNAITDRIQRMELYRLRAELGRKYKFENYLKGHSDWVKELYPTLHRAAQTAIPVALYGEPGTGKRLIARLIHNHSAFASHSLVEVPLSAISAELMETELFGMEKVSVSGEREVQSGKIEEAQRSTLYLRDIEKLPLAIQERLANMLEEKIYTRIGASNPLRFSSRLIVSSAVNLLEYVRNGEFSETLYYRLIGLPVRVDSLRERENDILILAKHFASRFCKEHDIPASNFTEEARNRLMNYPYPGNVGELKSVVELAVVMAEGRDIEAADIRFFRADPMVDLLLKERTMDEYHRGIINVYLDRYGQDFNIVSTKLDIGKSTIYRLKKHNLL